MYEKYIKNKNFLKENKKSALPFLVITLAMFIGWFLMKDMYYTHLDLKESYRVAKLDMDSKKQTLDSFNAIKQKIESNEEEKKNIDKYAWDFREDLIINSIFAKSKYSNNSLTSSWSFVSIKSLTMDKWEKLSNWLSVATISVDLEAQNLKELSSFTDSLVDNNDTTRFLIRSINFPYNSKGEATSLPVNLSLWMYYLEK